MFEALERLNNLPPHQRQRELYFIKNSIAGYIEYFKKYGTECINAYYEV